MMLGVVLVLALLVFLPLAEAAVPRQISLAGLRHNTTGGAEKNFFHQNVNFTFFDSAIGGRIIDTRLVNISTNTNGFWFVNYSTSGFDADIDLWLAINNTAPRIFLAGDPYSSQYIKRNESNTLNSTLTLDKDAGISGRAGLLLNSTSGLNASALLFGTVPSSALSNLVQTSVANIFTAVQTLNPIAIIGNITLGGNLTHLVGGLLINNTGGINASAVGFGTLPIGVLASTVPLTNVVNAFTAGQRFAGGLNVTGEVNITAISNTDHTFVVYKSTGALLFGIDTVNNLIHMPLQINMSFASVYSGDAISVGKNGWDIFRVDLRGGGIIHAESTLNITNITHDRGGLLINSTGGINASAVGFGSVPIGVLPVFPNGQTAVQSGLRVAFGNVALDVVSATQATSVVSMAAGFTCTACYGVTVSSSNFSGNMWSSSVINMNASQFNITTLVGASGPPNNITWIAVGY